jgi:hypothetical protein
MRVNAPLRCLIAFALLAAAPGELACGGSDDGNTRAEHIKEIEIQSLAAYACMPADLRRELRTLERRHDARVRALARASLPKGATGGTTPPIGFEQTVEADKVRSRLLRRARAIYGRFSPGGRDYDAGCYLREREKARNTVEGA